jgi:hypothetical protein
MSTPFSVCVTLGLVGVSTDLGLALQWNFNEDSNSFFNVDNVEGLRMIGNEKQSSLEIDQLQGNQIMMNAGASGNDSGGIASQISSSTPQVHTNTVNAGAVSTGAITTGAVATGAATTGVVTTGATRSDAMSAGINTGEPSSSLPPRPAPRRTAVDSLETHSEPLKPFVTRCIRREFEVEDSQGQKTIQKYAIGIPGKRRMEERGQNLKNRMGGENLKNDKREPELKEGHPKELHPEELHPKEVHPKELHPEEFLYTRVFPIRNTFSKSETWKRKNLPYFMEVEYKKKVRTLKARTLSSEREMISQMQGEGEDGPFEHGTPHGTPDQPKEQRDTTRTRSKTRNNGEIGEFKVVWQRGIVVERNKVAWFVELQP